MDRKTQNRTILQATKDDCELYTIFSKGIASTREQQYVIWNYEALDSDPIECSHEANLTVSGKDCFSAAFGYRGKKTTVINFGSSEMPDGIGADQESSMCRTSTLHKCLAYKTLWNQYYLPNKIKKPLFTDIVYSPDIIVFKSEQNPTEQLPEEDWYQVDVLTTALPVMRKEKKASEVFKLEADESKEFSKEELESQLYERFLRLFRIAYMKGTEVLILPAPGKNYRIDEKVLAKALRQAVEEFLGAFENIEISLAPGYYNKKTVETIYKTFDFEMPSTPVEEDRKESEDDIIRFGKTHELYGGFSNFNGPTYYDGRQYKCSEAAWQSMKTMDPEERDKFVPLTGSAAKSKGREVTLRPDWEQVKNQLMVDVCYAKFTQNQDLKELLLSTGEKTLIENTTGWHDNYWGDCQCSKCKNKPGLNHLGLALMEVRKMIREEDK